jgi:hypothetical protein
MLPDPLVADVGQGQPLLAVPDLQHEASQSQRAGLGTGTFKLGEHPHIRRRRGALQPEGNRGRRLEAEVAEQHPPVPLIELQSLARCALDQGLPGEGCVELNGRGRGGGPAVVHDVEGVKAIRVRDLLGMTDANQ